MQNRTKVQNSTYKAKKQDAGVETIEMLHPKYRIAELLRTRYGELNTKTGKLQLMFYCKLKNERTVNDWLNIYAGDKTEINHLLIEKVAEFFHLNNADELLTEAHKKLIA